jgi:hypothetical protein
MKRIQGLFQKVVFLWNDIGSCRICFIFNNIVNVLTLSFENRQHKKMSLVEVRQNSPMYWSTWKTKGIETVNDLVTGNKCISMKVLRSNFELTDVDSFKYMQLKEVYISQHFYLKSFGHQSNQLTNY